MPFGDGTGPRGMGSMTGRGAGYCAGSGQQGFASPTFGRGWINFNRGFGCGRGYGMGRGMGMRGRIMPLSAATPQSSGPEQEIETLKDQSQALREQATEIQRRIEELERK